MTVMCLIYHGSIMDPWRYSGDPAMDPYGGTVMDIRGGTDRTVVVQ